MSYTSLDNILQDFGHWPTQSEFIRKVITVSDSYYPERKRKCWIGRLYVELTQVYRRVEKVETILGDNLASITHNSVFGPNVGIRVTDKLVLFPNIQRPTLKQIFIPKPLEAEQHPIFQDLHGGIVKEFVKFSKEERCLLLPVQDDLQMRLALRLLPVRSRFWFLANQIPDVQSCPFNDCGAMETAKHTTIATIYSTFSSHYRRLLRYTKNDNNNTYTAIIQKLRSTEHLGDYIRRNEEHFRVRHIQLHLTYRTGVIFQTLTD
ncbi:Hypothetical protein PHPALM_153 [Phytophthora palmivora]|uniref:Uncharacterized protein n=1 Tax=Phytophthora palmivora TaxID=4796 RepID=A0A2P4YVL2_9STRA|nr:Hypothetical protein PHPALM_153 [Phytophthora palmivora]